MYNLKSFSTWIYLLVIMLALQACSTLNPIGKAETVEQRAYATYGIFVIMQEQAVKLVASGTLSNRLSLRIINAEAKAKPISDSLLEVMGELQEVKAQFQAGETGVEQYLIVTESLNNWTEQLRPLILNLQTALKGE